MKVIKEQIKVRDINGKQVYLNYNEPRPDLENKIIPSRFLNLKEKRFNAPALRIQIEHMLSHSCGEKNIEKIKAMGLRTSRIIIKIIQDGECCIQCGSSSASAISLLGYFPDADAVQFLQEKAVNKKEPINIRASAIHSLGRTDSRSAITCLNALVAKETHPALLKSLAFALGLTRSVQAIPALEVILKKCKVLQVKRRAVMSLRYLEICNGLPASYTKELLQLVVEKGNSKNTVKPIKNKYEKL